MKRKTTPYQSELRRQSKEHPRLPEKYLRMISHDHIDLKQKGKRSHG